MWKHLSQAAAWSTVGIVCLGVLSTADAQSQSFGNRAERAVRRPTTSPYLNLLRSGGTGGNSGFGGLGTLPLDYYELVRPQQQFRSAFEMQQSQLNQLRRQQTQLGRELRRRQADSSALGTTGHPTSFMNLQGYFPGASQ